MGHEKMILYFYLVVIESIRHHQHRRLSAIPADGVTTSRVINALLPADSIAIVADIKHHLDCSLLCMKHRFCLSSSFIRVSNICLLSQSVLKAHEKKAWDESLLLSVYTELRDQDGFGVRSTKILPNTQLPFMCGMNIFASNSLRTRRKRIIGGWTPEPYQAPWLGLLVKKGRVRCTAFLVSKKATDRASMWALSAKHCFLDAMSEDDPVKKINLKHFSFLFGVHDIRVKTQRSIYPSASAIFLPPDEGIKPKDVVLVKLDRHVKLDGYINGLCLPDIMEEYLQFDDTPCVTCGFGATKMDRNPVAGSNTLQCIEVEAQESDWDHNLFSDWNSVVNLKAVSFGPYQGDSGSPIFCHSGRLWSFLFAIVTGGQSSVFKNAYMTAARIAYFMDFINVNIQDDLCCLS